MPRATAHKRGYDARWRKYRLQFLAENPLCKFCEEGGKVTAATVVDHITPHKGDPKLFWDPENHQGLCNPHHNSTKQRMEAGTLRTIGVDGWPVEETNPVAQMIKL